MDLAKLMHNNIKASRTVLEAMLRNILSTLQLSQKADRETKILLTTCLELQCKYCISHRVLLLSEGKRRAQLSEIPEDEVVNSLLSDFKNIISTRNIYVDNETFTTVKEMFYTQKRSVRHIPEFVLNLKESILTNLWDLKCPTQIQLRFKSYLSFVIKMCKKFEKKDYLELNSFYDFIAFKLILMSQPHFNGSSLVSYSYEVLNQTITSMIECGYNLIPLKVTGKADKNVNPLYADYIKDYISNPKYIYKAETEEGTFEVDNLEKCKTIEKKFGCEFKWTRSRVYQALHFACCKNQNFGEGQITTSEFIKSMRNHSKFKKDTRGEIETIFNPFQYNLVGFEWGDETSDFYYLKTAKIFFNEIIRPTDDCYSLSIV